MFLIIALYHVYKAVNPAKVAVVDKKGIWTNKSGMIDWESMAAYYSIFKKDRHAPEELFYIQLKDTLEEIIIDLSSANVNSELLRMHINKFKGDNQILDFDEFDH